MKHKNTAESLLNCANVIGYNTVMQAKGD